MGFSDIKTCNWDRESVAKYRESLEWIDDLIQFLDTMLCLDPRKRARADEYSQRGAGIYSTSFAMLLCRVVCGEMFRMTKSDHPALEAALATRKYDGVLGDREASVGTYREFVVFDS